MPIEEFTLNRIKNNDTSLTELDLSLSGTKYDIGYFLARNNFLDQGINGGVYGGIYGRMSDVMYRNSQDDEIHRNDRKRRLYNEDIQKLAKALAINTTITSLDLANNNIGDKQAEVLAQALATNKTLLSLNVSGTSMSKEWEHRLQAFIIRNNQQLVERRNQFLRVLIILAKDQANSASQSFWHQLSEDLKWHILSLITFLPDESIGKNIQQIKACAKFIFNNVPQTQECLAEAFQTKQNFKLIEKISQGERQFQFFPMPTKLLTDISPSAEPFKKTNPIFAHYG